MNREQLYESFDNGVLGLDDIIDISQKNGYNQALEDLVKLVCEYYTMQEKAGYCADTNNMIKQRVADFAEQLRK